MLLEREEDQVQLLDCIYNSRADAHAGQGRIARIPGELGVSVRDRRSPRDDTLASPRWNDSSLDGHKNMLSVGTILFWQH